MTPLLAAQRLLALLALGLFVGRVSAVRRPAAAPRVARPLQLFSEGVTVLFVVALAWQTFWVLQPERVAGFREVEKYDRRAWELHTVTDRRAVTDREGVELIGDRLDGGRVHRVYPLGEAAAHVTGYCHRKYGKTGLELACDDQLSTWRHRTWEPLQRSLEGLPPGPPEPLRLTLDARLQQAAYQALGSQRGAVVVLNPAVGDVLALVSRPSFDPNRIDDATFRALAGDDASPLLARAVRGLYPPGSTFKIVTAATALAAGYPVETSYHCAAAGFLPPYDTQPIRDYEAGAYEAKGKVWPGHGTLDMAGAMARSANSYFAWLGNEVGGEALLGAARAFGVENRWDLVGGAVAAPGLQVLPGSLPDRRLKPGDVARCAIGQHEILVTPFAMALVAATVADYGVQVPPRLLADRPAGRGEQVLDAVTARKLQLLMRGVVRSPAGTARGLRLGHLDLAAKTGSADNPHGRAHAWVVAFAPVDRATVALAVLVENAGTGAGAAVPVARQVLQAAEQAGYFAAPGTAESREARR